MSKCRETDLTKLCSKFVEIDLASRLRVEHRLRQLEGVAGPDHGRQCLFSRFPVGWCIRKRPYALPARKTDRGSGRFFGRKLVRRCPVFFVDAGGVKRLADASGS